MTDALFIDYIFKTDNEKFDIAKQELLDKVKTYEYFTTPEEIKEFTDIFFDNRTGEDIDFDYLIPVALALPTYEKELEKQVDTYAVSFTYQEMDVMDQAIFLLWYVESKILDTPKEVLLNEMIELAKRYSDDGAPKLINGIMHKILTPEVK